MFVDAEGSHAGGEEGFPARGRAPHQPAARAHCEVLRRLRGRRSAHHGVRIHEARRSQQVPQVRSAFLLANTGCSANASFWLFCV